MKELMNSFAKTKLYKVLESTWLCIKFPFLYPRNRQTGTHWHSLKIHEYLYGHPQMATYKNGEK